MSDELEAVGALATASLAAAAIDGGQDHGAAEHGICANCGARLGGAFCHVCGQSAHIHRSLLHLVEEVVHGILHFDTKGWKTIPLLVAFPGRLTRRYIDGQRKTYVSPLALFLFMVFLTFFVASLGGGSPAEKRPETPQEHQSKVASLEKWVAQTKLDVEHARAAADKARKAGADANDIKDLDESVADARERQQNAEQALQRFVSRGKADLEVGEPGWTGKLLKDLAAKPVISSYPAVDKAIRHAAENPDLALYKLKNTTYKFSFMLIPISLPFVWLLFFWKRAIKMYDHAVFVLYSLCFMSLLFVVLVLLSLIDQSWAIPWLAILAPPVHMFVQLRGTYGLGKFAALWRTMVLLVVAMIVISLFVVFVLMMSMR
jgi:hypothetical protein